MKNLPKISIVTCTFNGERVLSEYFKKIFEQTYPKEKIEIIIADGGSTDKSLEIINRYRKKYPKIIKFHHNKMQYSIGKGYGMDNATKKAKGEIIVQLDQDNILVQKDWLEKMVLILIKNKEISAVQSRLYVYSNASPTDKYVNAIGIEDPFAIHYSLSAQVSLNPKRFAYNQEGDFYIYEVNKRMFLYAGDNGFVIRRKDFFDAGGYTQDIDNFYRMASSKRKYRIAIPKKIKLYHNSTTGFKHLIEKRAYYVRHYLLKNIKDRDFYWFSLKRNTFFQNLRFILSVSYNLFFIPGLIKGLIMAFKEKESYWLLHPFLLSSVTLAYIYSFFYSRIFKRQKEASI